MKLLRLLPCALALLSTACETRLEAVTTPPGGYVGELDEDADRLTLSPGVALALRCTRNGSPCGDLGLTVDDPTVATARPAILQELGYSTEAQTDVPVAAFVVVAHRPGVTTLRITGDAEADYEIVVP